MLLNEFVQWAAIIFLGIFVVGLTRQLGVMVRPTDASAHPEGPPVGSNLAATVFQDAEQKEIERLVARGGPFALIALEEGCPDCQTLTTMIRSGRPWEGPLPLVGLVQASGQDFLFAAGEAFDLVLSDPEGFRATALGIGVFPTALLLDERRTVLAKGLGGDGVLEACHAFAGGQPLPAVSS